MLPATSLQSLYLRYFAKPSHHRKLFRHLVQAKVRRIVQLGLADGSLSQRLISLALHVQSTDRIRFAGVDLFEGRRNATTVMSLKDAHRKLQSDQAEIRLVPGEPVTALTRLANELRGTDLVVISADTAEAGLASCWHLLSRILHKDSQIWREEAGTRGTRFQVLGPADIRDRTPARKGRAA